MDITVRDYYLIRKNIIQMLYDRSEQQIGRFHFERGFREHRVVPGMHFSTK